MRCWYCRDAGEPCITCRLADKPPEPRAPPPAPVKRTSWKVGPELRQAVMDDLRSRKYRRGVIARRHQIGVWLVSQIARELRVVEEGWDPRPCECGSLKRARAECCARCAYLDGIPVSEGRWAEHRDWEIIAAMREGAETATVGELADVTGRAYESVIRTMRRLSKAGRVRRILEHDEAGGVRPRFFLDATEAPRSRPAPGRKPAAANQPAG